MIPYWMISAGLALAAICGGWLAALLLLKMGRKLARLTGTRLDDITAEMSRGPLVILGPLLCLSLLVPILGLPESVRGLVSHVLGLSVITCLTWLGIRLTGVGEAWFLDRYDISIRDNLKARAVQTQVRIIRRVVVVILLLVGVSTGLMTFEKVRQLGTGILTSAGVAGIILGLAAQRTISTLMAGLQIAVTQPFRIEDVLVVENEWGKVEEITLTYVVLRIWDQRRLVLPITYFLDKPFQNWTRVSAEILGSVFLYMDYTVPVEAMREELHRIVSESDLWDGRVCVLQVTNATERTVELRALVSAVDSSKAWDLRCLVREKLIAFVQRHCPGSLPKVRASLQEDCGGKPQVMNAGRPEGDP